MSHNVRVLEKNLTGMFGHVSSVNTVSTRCGQTIRVWTDGEEGKIVVLVHALFTLTKHRGDVCIHETLSHIHDSLCKTVLLDLMGE
jgi:hypothetical protein